MIEFPTFRQEKSSNAPGEDVGFDLTGTLESSCFTDELYMILAIMNSIIFNYLLTPIG